VTERVARGRVFLRARWEQVVLLNYTAPVGLLEPLVPRGTELDRFGDEAVVSLVGFLFADTRVLGLAVPGHRSFEEVNLRFYVRRIAKDGTVRRAVVFVRELVPRAAIAAVARYIYNEPYLAVPMAHDNSLDSERGGYVCYAWRHAGSSYALEASVSGPAQPLERGSEAEFITEHYFGYTRQRDGGTLEYGVEHPAWRVWTTSQAGFFGPAGALYGDPWGALLATRPRSAFVALGSEVTVRVGERVA
jgi:uncharacterized protein YqjF (DUF2071 family)